MKRVFLPLLFIFLGAQIGAAQSVVDANIGFGTLQASRAPYGVDSETGEYCTLGAPFCDRTPRLTGFFMGFGANFMLWDKFGIGMQAKLQPAKQQYGSIFDTRATFYDFSGIWQPWRSDRASVQLSGGLGGVNVKTYFSDTFCTGPIGCQSYNYALGSSNHFQLKGGAGVQVYLTDAIFLRPQVDVHWVNDFHQFGSNTVPSYMVWLGYSFGSR